MKKFPPLASDAEAEQFVDHADLSEFDFSNFTPTRFEFAKKDARVNFRVPVLLLNAVKKQAAARGMPYQRFIREVLERAVN